MDNIPWDLYQNLSALQDTEQSLYQVLEHQNPQFQNQIESPEVESNENGNLWIGDAEFLSPAPLQVPVFSDSSSNTSIAPSDISNQQMVHNMMNNVDSILQFQKGFEEGNKFIPVINLGTFDTNQKPAAAGIDGSRGRKNHDREDEEEERRSVKQSAVYVDEMESEQLSEMFDKVLLLCKPVENAAVKHEESKIVETNGGAKARSRKREKKKETVDLRTLLVLCAQAVSAFDRRTASELLKQIQEHSSPSGDGSQRLAHYFAKGLEARLEGSAAGIHNFYSRLVSYQMTAADILRAYKVHLTACPFKKLSIVFANKIICKMAEKANAKVLHIVDFGILFGFQWPILIQLLSMRVSGPPKLRITGIELPQRGFRPSERIEETGRRLAKYCERFNVPFEYNAIAVHQWEKIKLSDLKIDNANEFLAVNNLFRFESLLDETAGSNCPRDAVLTLIKTMKPDIVVHIVVNGSYNAPFFLTRFREALFHFSAIYDVFDTTMPRDDPDRLMLEDEFYGREAMNVVACEGAERVQRAETYKQWHQRISRAGFKAIPLDKEVMEVVRGKLKNCYHKEFVIDEDGCWMLQGWKGRILYAASCWVPDETWNV